ncbi:hypothetical protein DB35_17435 [Streptomyces abyssalis]|uniref:Uncharacterized protein n=1 Tax=Streptomyces abyssalis TaxID=933944 RepID=A0A1E7JKL2_9ACTN|nr:hypothetical protein [Streptomyces abyssalis]OEU88176.1 hypothetical protein AN215_18605 [Streptomyces abyssalis]OEU91047.1 hypothetical protein DB35_17435 [Streptomyces abyssalis]
MLLEKVNNSHLLEAVSMDVANVEDLSSAEPVLSTPAAAAGGALVTAGAFGAGVGLGVTQAQADG